MPIKITETRTIAVGETVTIAGDYIGLVTEGGYVNDGYVAPSLIIRGSLLISGDGIVGGGVAGVVMTYSVAARSLLSIEVGGLLKVTGSDEYSKAYGVRPDLSGVDIVNRGHIDVRAGQEAVGVSTYLRSSYDSRSDLTFDNSGTLTVAATRDAATGVIFTSKGLLTNSGLIQVTGGAHATGVLIGGSGFGRQSAGGTGGPNGVPTFETRDLGFINWGTIRATTGGDLPSVGVSIAGKVALLVNVGLIDADFAINQGTFYGYDIASTTDRIENYGELRGRVQVGGGDDQLTNAGKITGLVELGVGNDLYDGERATAGVTVHAGAGADALIGGGQADIFFGEADRDILLGGGGDDFLDGGDGADLIDGGAGFDTASWEQSSVAVAVDLAAGVAGEDRVGNIERVIGSAWKDTLTGSAAAEVLEGRDGNDVLIGGGGADTLIGGVGDDRFTGGAGDDSFVFEEGDGEDTITDFVAGGTEDRLRIFGYTNFLELIQDGADTVVVLSATDQLRLTNVQASALTASDFVFGGAGLVIPASPVPPLNRDATFGTLNVTSTYNLAAGESYERTDGYGLRLSSPGGTGVGASFYNAGTLRMTAQPHLGGLTAVATDPTSNFSTAVFYNMAGGLIETLSSGNNGDIGGVAAHNSGLDIWNAGTVHVTAGYGTTRGIDVGGAGEADTVVNSGSIKVEAGHFGYGLIGNANGIWNSGLIEVAAAYGWGVHFGAPNGTFVNSGTIKATSTGPEGFGAALELSQFEAGVVSIYNSGTLQGVYAVRQRYGASDDRSTERIYNSGQILGRMAFNTNVQEIHNRGSINGRIDLGILNDLYDGRGGTQTGGVYGDDGNDTLLAGAGANQLFGGAGNDILSGGAGADILTGGTGDDSFRFEAGSGGDTITDFVAGSTDDRIVVVGYAGYQSLVQQGADTKVVFSATDFLLLTNVQASALTAADFVFSAAALPAAAALPTAPAAPAAPTPPSGPGPSLVNKPELGTAGDDSLIGTDAIDVVLGRGGDDILRGGLGPIDIQGFTGRWMRDS